MDLSSDEEIERDESNTTNKVACSVEKKITELTDGRMNERKLRKFELDLRGNEP